MVQPPQTDFESAETFVATDIPCLKCGYNLRGLPPEGRCPECGFSIEETRDRGGWCADRTTVARLRECSEFVIVSAVFDIAALPLLAFSNNDWIKLVVYFLAVISLGLSVAGNGSAIVYLHDILPRAPRRIPWNAAILLLALVVATASDRIWGSAFFYSFFVLLTGVLPIWTAHSAARLGARLTDGRIKKAATAVVVVGAMFSWSAIAYLITERFSSLLFRIGNPYQILTWMTDWLPTPTSILFVSILFVAMRILQVHLMIRVRRTVVSRFV